MKIAWVLLGILSSCYSPIHTTCSITCDGDPCPSGMVCRGDGFCHGDELEEDCPVPEFQLEVNLVGSGANTVAEVDGFVCSGGSCVVSLPRGRHILVATPDTGALVTGWQLGDVPGPACGATVQCSLEVDLQADTQVSAFFDPARALTISRMGDGEGNVIASVDGSMVLTCDAPTCEARLPVGTIVTLDAFPTAPSEFLGFDGCTGDPLSCTVPLTELESTINTRFEVVHITLLPLPAMSNVINQITFDDLGPTSPVFTCAPTCDFLQPPSKGSAPRRLIAVPAIGFQFNRWISIPPTPCDALPRGSTICSTATFPDDTLVIGLFESVTKQLVVNLTVNGPKVAITVDGAGVQDCINGPATCVYEIGLNSLVSLNAAPGLVDWHGVGGCTGEDSVINPCVIQAMIRDVTVQPEFP